MIKNAITKRFEEIKDSPRIECNKFGYVHFMISANEKLAECIEKNNFRELNCKFEFDIKNYKKTYDILLEHDRR